MSNLKIFFLLYASVLFQITIPYTIVLDICNGAGREIQNCYERGLCLQTTKALKEKIEENKNFQVMLAQQPGQQYQNNHSIIFTNRIMPDLYIKLGLYYQEELPLQSSFFYYACQPLDLKHQPNPLFFYPYHDAYLTHIQKTDKIVQACQNLWTNKEINTTWQLQGAYAIPCNLLSYINAPAFYIECGLNQSHDWQYLVNPLALMITQCLS